MCREKCTFPTLALFPSTHCWMLSCDIQEWWELQFDWRGVWRESKKLCSQKDTRSKWCHNSKPVSNTRVTGTQLFNFCEYIHIWETNLNLVPYSWEKKKKISKNHSTKLCDVKTGGPSKASSNPHIWANYCKAVSKKIKANINLNIDASEHVGVTNSNQREKIENQMRFLSNSNTALVYI